MEFNRIEFLEWFDTEEVKDEEAGYVDYSVTQDDIKLSISMNIYEDWVCFTEEYRNQQTLFDFMLPNISHIKCYKDRVGLIQFLFYQYKKEQLTVILNLKPFISITLKLKTE
ncbi:MAG TPA: hypothetical protein VFF04_02215 [Candidatus Babeliales bacterium]|nr:hypothetical protein [Candidatus Babeliales bacterium]